MTFRISFRWSGRVLALALLALLLVPALALAAQRVTQPPHLIFPSKQVWELVIGAFVPLVTYVVNHAGPWLTEPVKATVLLVATVIAGAIYAAIGTSTFGFNTQTLQMVLTAVVAALAAHGLLWKPSGISTVLGAGRNRRVAGAGASGAGPVAPGEEYPRAR